MSVKKKKQCLHEKSHITDSRFYGHGYSTPESKHIFCEICRLQRWLDVEVALSLSQAELGVIPQEAADAIAQVAVIEQLDLQQIAEDICRTGHSLVPLLRALQSQCPSSAGEFIHFGATTQDIQDTAQSLEMQAVLIELKFALKQLFDVLIDLANNHREDLIIGRTHAQPALPTSFGLKVAGWIDELLRHWERIIESEPRILAAQLFGGVGTMASFGEHGLELLERFAKRLSLSVPLIGWHVARDRIAEFVHILAMLSTTFARIADELRLLSRPEIGELELPWEYGQIGSSTMPHKRNPEECEQVVVLARLAKALVPSAIESMIQEHERDYRGTRLDWVLVADVSHFTLTSASLILRSLKGLKVNVQRMKENAHESAEAICTEAFMLELAPHIGKQSAHALVYELSQRSKQKGVSLQEIVRSNATATDVLDSTQLEKVLDPTRYLGMSGSLVERTIARLNEVLNST